MWMDVSFFAMLIVDTRFLCAIDSNSIIFGYYLTLRSCFLFILDHNCDVKCGWVVNALKLTITVHNICIAP